ncbi:branched-chain amino acid ABC transporter permease [Isobaculum melis]|uniref:Amino acid/amide ABC transporter membrane protein 2, HAAT family n=1 Tax=Isobaculum melis TaxID=142588 RepID=A0A1H9PVE6_9LACT|nr:branched-chain amino acid ABC transporter permease [Isobaculum melis]SER52194.1 amino acid/amide ABC transporter membrane protein 2, HAAT family [Isobaculum melis]
MKQLNKYNAGWLALSVIIYFVVQMLIQADVIDYYYQITLMNICMDIILALGLNLIIGFTGQFSLGHAGFMSIGAYCCAIMMLKMPDLTGFLLGLLLGVIVASLVALIVAIPTLRLKGDYLAIATLGISEIIRIAILNMGDLTNGAAGLSGMPILNNWTLSFFGIMLSLIIIVNYIKSSPGRATIAIREDEIAAESMGINTTKYKTIAFVIGAFTASIAGSLYASSFSMIKPDNFGFMKSVDILIIVVFGGLGSVTGTIIAAISLGILNMLLQPFGQLRMIIYAIALIAIMVFKPGGLLQHKELSMKKLFGRLSKKNTPKKEASK